MVNAMEKEGDMKQLFIACQNTEISDNSYRDNTEIGGVS